MAERVSVFSNGSQYADWQSRNCDRCTKYNPEKYDGQCDLDLALGMSYIDDGLLEQPIAERLGYVEGVAFGLGADGTGFAYGWDCPERALRPVAA